MSLVAQLCHSRTGFWSEQARAVFQAGELALAQMSAPVHHLLKGS